MNKSNNNHNNNNNNNNNNKNNNDNNNNNNNNTLEVYKYKMQNAVFPPVVPKYRSMQIQYL